MVLAETQVLAADQLWYDGFELTMHAEIKVSAQLLGGPAVDLFVVDDRVGFMVNVETRR